MSYCSPQFLIRSLILGLKTLVIRLLKSRPSKTPQLLLGIWSHLARRRRVQLCLLFVVMLASGVSELVSLGSVLPFLAVLNSPEELFLDPRLNSIVSKLGYTDANQIILPITIIFIFAVIFASLVRMFNLWLNLRLSSAIGSDLSCEAYRRTLYQPYTVHLNRNSSSVITNITSQIALTVSALNAFLGLVTASFVSLSLLLGLLVIDSQVAIFTSVLFGFAYWILAISSRRKLRMNGREIAEATKNQLKALQEGLGAIRDVLLDGTQAYYLQMYRKSDRTQRQLQANNAFLANFPRYSLEALGVSFIALLGGMLTWQRGNGVVVIPLLGALALGSQRLLPALQQIYAGWATLKGHNTAISNVLEMLEQQVPKQIEQTRPLNLTQKIYLEKISFRYDKSLPNVFSGLSLEIYPGERIGLIGTTGSGKSTIVDLLMGLLKPTSGRLLIDGKDIHDPDDLESLASWKSSIAHVPQNIYLADSSVAENIAFGVPYARIDFDRVKYAAEKAQISSFFDKSKDGYNTFVGERGVRLSGGQRQRIGIARALYKKSRILVLDEATSALDNTTEEAIMSAVENLSQEYTIIMIAHRLSTIQRCDQVIQLGGGGILAEGHPSLFIK